MSSDEGYSTEKVNISANYIRSKLKNKPKIAIICGSGLGGLGEMVENKIILKYSDIPSFVEPKVVGHKGRLIFGQIGGKEVLCMQGRYHSYEGYDAWVIGFPIRVMKLLGIEVLIVTSAAGSLNPEYKVGDFMLLKDHISMVGMGGYNPLRGPNDSTFGPRFIPMHDAYDKNLSKLFQACASELNIKIKEGVYCQVAGPNYETVAAMRLLKLVGGDAVGMSTVQEVVTARHCGIKVIACSIITDEGILEYDSTLTICHEEVLEKAESKARDMEMLVSNLICKIQS